MKKKECSSNGQNHLSSSTCNGYVQSIRILLKLFLLSIVVLFLVTNAFSTTYYVATNGNNGNNGTSTSTPWKTINYAVNYSGLAAGDVIYIRGGSYYERAVMQKSGSSAARITVAKYNGEIPIIDGTGVTFVSNEDHQGLFDVRASYVTIDGLKVINSNPGINEANATGICVRGPGVRDVTIKNCITNNTRSSGIAIWGQTTGNDYSGCQNIIIENCDISNALNDGYQEHLTIAKGVDNFTIRNNVVRDGSQNSAPRSPNLPIGIDAKVNVRNGKIYGNQVFNLPLSNGVYVDGWDTEAYNIEIYNNIIHHVAHTGIPIGAEEGGTTHDIKVYNNLIYNCGNNGIAVTASNSSTQSAVYNIQIYNNTVYGCSNYAMHVTNPSSPGVVIKNNIFSQNVWSNAVTVYPGNKGNLTVSNNITNGDQNAWISGMEIMLGSNANSSSPSFANTGGGNFRLNSGSPAINTGTSSGLTLPSTDLDGNNRVAGGTVDRGAYEFGSTSGGSPCESCSIEGNLLANPGFENNLTTGWTDDWGNSSRVSDNYYTGFNSLKVGTGQGGRAQVLTSGFIIGAEYTLTAYCKLSATGAPAGTNIGVVCKNSSGTRTGTFSSTDIISTSWTKKSVVFTVPANTFSMEVNVWYPGGTPSVYVDDFVLQKNISQENMLQNYGFESDLSVGWTSDWGNTSRITSPIRSGSYSLNVGPSQGGRAQVLTSGFSVGDTYTVSAYCRLSTIGAPAGTNIGAVCKNSSGIRTGTFTSSDITTTSWVQKLATFTVPAYTTTIEVNVWYPGGTPSVYVDDFAMVPGSAALKSGSLVTSANLVDQNSAIRIYPNPNISRILQINSIGIEDEQIVTIHDLSGRQVFKTTLIGSETHQIDINELIHNGLYIVRIRTKEKVFTEKLLLE